MKKLLLFLTIFTSTTLVSLATHIIGGDLTYACKGNKIYYFTLTIYSECGSEAVLESYYPIYYFSPSQKILQSAPKNFILTKQYEEEVSIFCPNIKTNCNGGTERGIRKVVYTGYANLFPYEYAKDWTFYWKKAARSEEITTLASAEDEDFFIKVTMDNAAADCNNSPTFQNNPVITACKGAERIFNHIATDQDGDELTYSLVSPQSSLGVDVVYKDGYNHNSFISLAKPADINPTTGDITFTATTTDQVGVTDVLVKEYRNGVLIGTMIRSMQITSLDCSNKAPEISGFLPDNKDSIAVCAGQKISLQIKGSDPDGQFVKLKLLTSFPGYFKVEEDSTENPTGTFVWNTQTEDAGKYIFTVEATDNGCPEPQSKTKTFIISVLSTPQFDLGPDLNVKCDTTVKLAPKITGGDGNYKYAWNTGSTASSITVETGTYSLTVTDGKGCSTTDKIIISSGIFTQFSVAPLCFDQVTNFTDNSYSLVGNIVKWNWDFGDKSTSTDKNPTHKYAAAGQYNIKLTVTTDKNCSSTASQLVTVCKAPTPDFINLDSCTSPEPYFLSPVTFQDLTPIEENCDVIKKIWDWGDGSGTEDLPPYKTPYINHNYTTEGLKTVQFTVITQAGCTSTVSKTIRIYRSPEINIKQDNYVFICNKPDSTLVSEILFPGNGDLKYEWNTSETTPNIDIHESGNYFLTVTDKFGGKDGDYVNVQFPLGADFIFTPYCQEGDEIYFTDISYKANNNSLIYEWQFGDGTSSALKNPVHKYPKLGIFNASLKIKDPVDGCESFKEIPVYNTFYIDTFAVFPKHISICVNNIVTGTGPEADLKNGSLINDYLWDFGNGQLRSGRAASTYYPQVGKYVVKLKVTYNAQAGINSGCSKIYTDTIVVYPEFKVDFDPFRVCVNDPVKLSFRRTAGDLSIGIKYAKWEITNPKTGVVDVLTDLSPIYTFEERQTYLVSLTSQDSVGCEFSITKSFFADVVETPEFTTETVCSGEKATFTADFKDTYENLTNLFWDFGSNDTINNFYTRPNTVQRTYPKGGEFPVKLTAYNSFTGCNSTITKTIKIIEHPVADFAFDTVCALQPMTFTNLSTIGYGTISNYQWDFGDGNVATSKDVIHTYKSSGYYKVTLTAISENVCATVVEKEVYVKEIPKADFDIEENVLEAFRPLHFINKSEGQLESYLWIFGDGTTSNEKDPIHQFDTVKIFTVKLIVTNNLGCSDTIIHKTNLNVRLDIPTAFTPNEDNLNDGLSLIHNGIKELYEFKIYNRWGELIFDAGNNINASWDGKFKGKLQEVGTYVAYVKALGAYDTKFSFKKNITLLK